MIEKIKKLKPLTKVIIFGVLPLIITFLIYFKINNNTESTEISANENENAFSFHAEKKGLDSTKLSNIEKHNQSKYISSNKSTTWGDNLSETFSAKQVENSNDKVKPLKDEEQKFEVITTRKSKNKNYKSKKSNKYSRFSNKRPKKEKLIVKDEPIDNKPKRRTRNTSQGFDNFNNTNKLSNSISIPAVVHNGNKLVRNGSSVRLRIMQDCNFSNKKIKKNSNISAIAQFTKHRLMLDISSISHKGQRIECSLIVHDKQGMKGLLLETDLDISKDATTEGSDGLETNINIPILGSIGGKILTKKIKDQSIRLYDGHPLIIR